ncbi:MAG: hypothetical protein DRP56_01335 [Planctomycetota bacterium]|nr:MAG: hypothetical protein DRP56_01335 [Planctomycetota bacterium]
MVNKQIDQWLSEQENRKIVLEAFNQPLISRQISKKTGLPQETCSYLIAKFVDVGLLVCLNPKARNCRLYWPTEKGRRCFRKLYRDPNRLYNEPELLEIDWPLYGWVCFGHRSAIIKALTHPMQPSAIKRLFRIQGTHLRISANNIRDIVRLFLSRGIVCPVKIRKKAHLRYELTDLGIKLRQLLIQADASL